MQHRCLLVNITRRGKCWIVFNNENRQIITLHEINLRTCKILNKKKSEMLTEIYTHILFTIYLHVAKLMCNLSLSKKSRVLINKFGES